MDISICSYCDSLMVPGINCKVRLLSGIKEKQKKEKKKKAKRITKKKYISITCFTCKKQNLSAGSNPEEIKQLEIKSNEISTKQSIATPKPPKKSQPSSNVNTNQLQSKKLQQKETTKMKKRRKQKSTLRDMLQTENEQKKQSSNSLSDFLQQL